ncbi:MAG: NRDE family protein [Chitinophagaceae bacterium]
MCTVSFVPTISGVIITSNRDENILRGNTNYPLEYFENKVSHVYPKDEKGSGTWIGYNEFNYVAVLLNGAFEKHVSKPPYKQSRGKIIPTILSCNNPTLAVEQINFIGIEPFTLILYGNKSLVEYKWDGNKLHSNFLHSNQCYLWNSATLYSKEMEVQNQKELNYLCSSLTSKNDVFDFHYSKKYELQLPQNSALNNIKTVSITQVIIVQNHAEMVYKDLAEISILQHQ